jgi:hypothetical protein
LVVSAEVGHGDSGGLIACTFEVGNLIRTDWATKSDPVVCALLFDDATQDFLPYARTELVIDSQSHTYLRRIVFRVPRDLSRQMMLLVTDDDYHEGQIERVDPKTNEIFLTTTRASKSQIVRFKRELHEAAEGEHGATYI